LNYLTDPELQPLVYHYDNLTAEGQRALGKKLTRDLSTLFAEQK
jgi:hypothetical protein